MLLPIVAAFLSGSVADGPRLAARPARPDFDAQQMVCRYEPEPSSRLARRKICRTAGEWAEERRLEQGNLRRNQYNGAQ
jgi:hypothetical protein